MTKILTAKNIGEITKCVGVFNETVSPYTETMSIIYQDEKNKPFNYKYFYTDYALEDFPNQELVYTQNKAFCIKRKDVERLAKLHNLEIMWEN